MAEALLRMAERVARLGAWRVDLPGFTSAWSDEVRAIRELPEGFVPVLEQAMDSYLPEDRPRMRAAIAACAEHGTPFDLELRLKTDTDRLIWVRVIGEAVRDSAGTIARLEGAIQDITGRRVAEEDARRLAHVVSDTLEHIADGFVTIDREWRFTFINREAERQTARSRDSLLGRNLWEAYPEMLGTTFETSYRRAMDENVTVEFEAWFEPLQSWFSIRAYPAPQGLAIYFYNITGQRDAREQARVSEERFHLLARATNDAIWDTDLITNRTWRSEGFEKLFGEKPDADQAADHWVTRIHPDDRQRVADGVDRALRDGGDSWNDEYRYLRQDGTVAYVFDRGYIIRDETRRPVRMIGGMSDLTERKKLEAQFLRAQRMESIGTLAGGIAHDLNNILAPILMSVGLLKDGETAPDRIRLLDAIEISGRRGSDMVRQVLSFARGVEGKRMQMNVRHLFRDVQKLMRESIARNIDVSFSAPPDLWTVTADVTQLHQVLMNLCVNARDAMPEGGSLTVVAANRVLDEVYTGMTGELSPGQHIAITVADSGTGMSPKTQERIFEPFFTTKDLGKGTGLGLSTVLTIIKSHGGTIDVHSEPGNGTTFTILLPADATQATGIVKTEAPLPRGKGELIMVVDDEEKIRTLARATLEKFGYRVVDAKHGAEAVALYAQHRDTALVITDLAMPVMDGFATMIALRAINPALRLIASSGQSTKDGDARARESGMRMLLNKPYTVDVLIRAVDDVLHDRPATPADEPWAG